MNSNTERFLGYILLSVGLICMLFAFFSLYNVFTGAVKPPDLFQMRQLQFSISSTGGQSMVVSVPLDSEARRVVNLFLYYLFMLFLVMAGGTLSRLGIQCIKE